MKGFFFQQFAVSPYMCFYGFLKLSMKNKVYGYVLLPSSLTVSLLIGMNAHVAKIPNAGILFFMKRGSRVIWLMMMMLSFQK